jgi:NitT/TauT family transport system ATP-binding protein
LPASDFAESVGLVDVTDGRARLTDAGRRLLAGSIRERKAMLRDLLRRTTLFRTLLRLLDSAPEHRLDEDQVLNVLELTPAPSEEVVQNIVNWGRFAELFRYDADERIFSLPKPRARSAARAAAAGGRPPAGGGGRPPDPSRPAEAAADEPGATRSVRDTAASVVDVAG